MEPMQGDFVDMEWEAAHREEQEILSERETEQDRATWYDMDR